jgi:hypothetical protein
MYDCTWLVHYRTLFEGLDLGPLKPKDAGMLSYLVLVTSPPVCGDKTTHCITVGTGLTPKRLWSLSHNCCGSCRPELTGSQRSEHTAMTIYAYLVRRGAGFRIQCLHWKILYKMPRGHKRKKEKKILFGKFLPVFLQMFVLCLLG